MVDAVEQADLDRFAKLTLSASTQGKHFLFRSAASLLSAFGDLPPQPIPAVAMGETVQSSHPGVFIVGSYVQKTTVQLKNLLALPQVEGIEIDLKPLQNREVESSQIRGQVLAQADTIFHRHNTPVIYTSRPPLSFTDLSERLYFNSLVSDLLANIVQQLPTRLGYLVSKGE